MQSQDPPPQPDPAVETGRRSFLLDALLGISGATVSALLAIPLVRFVTYPLRQGASDADWSDVAHVDELTGIVEPVARTILVQTRDAWQTRAAQTAVYVLPPQAGHFKILSPVCPHLGCSVRWIAAQSQFICPCHNGTFDATGQRISGPPRRSMDSLDTKVVGGVLKVRYKFFRQLLANKQQTA